MKKNTVYSRDNKSTVTFRLEPERIDAIKKYAHRIGLGYTSLVRSWVVERLNAVAQPKKE